MNKLVGAVLGAALFSVSNASHAHVDCTGEVSTLSLQLDSQGTVTLSLTGGPAYTYLCAIEDTRNGVSPTVCRTMYATLVAAKTAGKKVLIRFYAHSSCSAIPSWADPGALGWTMLLLD